LIKREKKFQEGKWEDLWKQSISEFETEKRNIKPQKELSITDKVWKSEHFDHAPEDSCSRWFWFDSECPCANFCQGRYGILIPSIRRILTSRGTTTLAPESNSPWMTLTLGMTRIFSINKNGLRHPC
jgi:hypothetical protein